MNKFNALGMKILSYKTEYLNKNYPQLVHDSIAVAIDNTSEIPNEIRENIKKMDFVYEDFETYLLSQSICLKTYQELLLEYESIRGAIENILISHENLKNIQTLSKVENETLEIKQEFIITEEFIRNYFTITSDSDFDVLMSRKGFIEKFAILRLTKIFDDFLNQIADKPIDFNTHHSLTFFKSENNVYGIHMEYEIPINNLDSEEKISNIGNKISEIALKAEENYKNHMIL